MVVATTIADMADDPGIEHLRGLIAQAIGIRDATRALIAEINDHLHLVTATGDDRSVGVEPRPERRKKPRAS